MATFHQVPAPFPLAQVVSGKGFRFSGARARVYDLLLQTKQRQYQHRIGSELGPSGWVPVHLFREPWSGGQSGGRRVRELREYGAEVEIQPFQGSDTTVYRLTSEIETSGAAVATDRATATVPMGFDSVEFSVHRGYPPADSGDPYPLVEGGRLLSPSPAATCPADYRQELRALHASGELLRELAGGRWAIYMPSNYSLPCKPLQVIAEALLACGARRMDL